MRRLIAIVLMLLLPIQSAWALVAMPCRGHVSPVQPLQAAAGMVHGGHAAQQGGMAGVEDALHDHAHHDAATAGHQHHGDHAAAPGEQLSDHDGLAPGDDPCSGSAACMSLHSPPLAQATAGLPVLKLPNLQPPGKGADFSSVPSARLQRPPIGLPA
ncbi:hypothetical protein [Azohydromonas caseinilytica]|uniref:Uncharacterized protein n=1 Tax=Azohydromonas caseinilytica TaxID=2728836 RepID=A0A848FG61_9BURK|nr:hypothetical protein [Azohydromonas caseinilytica]NML18354.1 hypothetical protein [Azohydromonas caseinilytica]